MAKRGLFGFDLLFWDLGELILGTAKVNVGVERSGFVKVKMLTQLLPHRTKINGLASHLEVINVNANKQLLPPMQVKTFPVLNCFEAASQERLLAVLLPVKAGLGMTIQVADELAHWITEALP